MASFRLNIARVRGAPAPRRLGEALESFGLPEGEQYGVLRHTVTEHAVFATAVRKDQQAVQTLDPRSREVTSSVVERVTVLPLCIWPQREHLEVYAGGAKSLEEVGAFLAGGLALPAVVDPVELDVLSAIDKLARQTDRFQLRAVRISEYAHDSYMSGPYAPKFLDTRHGRDFLEDYAEYIRTASVRFRGPGGNVTAHLSPRGCFRFACEEDDEQEVRGILRKVV